MNPTIPLLATLNFLDRLDIGGEDDCWEWTGPRHKVNHYGAATYNNKVIGAHRLSWIIHNGPIPAGLEVMHSCDYPPCCNPRHLRVGTHKENMDDRDAKGRQAYGERSGVTKLTEQQARAIIKAWAEKPSSAAQIAEQLGVSPHTVWNIVAGRKWKHLHKQLALEAVATLQ